MKINKNTDEKMNKNKTSKINKFFSIIALIMMDVLTLHVLVTSILFLINKHITVLIYLTNDPLLVLFVIHLVLAVIKMIKHVDHKKILSLAYFKYNYKTFIQRLSAILMVPLLVVHIYLSKNMNTYLTVSIGKKIMVILLEALFYAVVFIHMSISCPKAKLALGNVTTLDQVKKMEKTEWIKNSILFLLGVISLIVFLLRGVM